jgi:putative transposase
MPKGLVRYYGGNDLHFITFSCYQRLPFLSTIEARNIFLEMLEEARRKYMFQVAGYVVMPEHVHLLLGGPKVGTLSTVVQLVKQRTARKVHDVVRGQMWQRRFYDFNVYTQKKNGRKAVLHARESGRARAGVFITGLGVEQRQVSQFRRTGDCEDPG